MSYVGLSTDIRHIRSVVAPFFKRPAFIFMYLKSRFIVQTQLCIEKRTLRCNSVYTIRRRIAPKVNSDRPRCPFGGWELHTLIPLQNVKPMGKKFLL